MTPATQTRSIIRCRKLAAGTGENVPPAYTTGFALGQPGPEDQVYSTSSYEQTADFVGLIQGYDPETGRVTIEQRNHVKEGERLEILNPDGEIFAWTVTEMQNDQGEPITQLPTPR